MRVRGADIAPARSRAARRRRQAVARLPSPPHAAAHVRSRRSQFAEHFAKRAEAELTDEEKARFVELEAMGKEARWTHGPEFLFDLGKEATGGTTPYEMKDARDTWYSMHRVKANGPNDLITPLQHTGGVMLSSHAYGENLKGYADWAKPEYARQPIIRDSFFRSTGVLRP